MPGTDFRQARQEIRLAEVLALLNYQPRQRQGEQLRGPCPVHRSQSATEFELPCSLSRNTLVPVQRLRIRSLRLRRRR